MDGNDSKLYTSTDGGNTFQKSPTPLYPRDIVVNNGTIYIGTDKGLFISKDGGKTYTAKTTVDGLVNNEVMSIFVNGNNLYIGTAKGLSISKDGGKIFTNYKKGNGIPSGVNTIFVSGTTVYLGVWGAGYTVGTANIKKTVAKLDPFTSALQWNLPGVKDIVSDDVGNIYAVAGHEIHKFDANGKPLSKWGKQGSGIGEFNNPTGITLDSQGSLYIADAGNNRIQKMDAGANFSLWATSATFSSLQKIATDMNDNIYVADASGYQKFDFNGTLISAWKGTVTGLAVDHSETVFATGDNTNAQRIDNAGTLSKKWTTSGKNSDIALDGFGDIHIVSSGSPVEKYDFDGKLLVKWGPSANAITMDFAENIYLADNNTIKKYKRTPEILLEMQGTWQNDADPTDRFEVKGTDFTNLKTNQKQSIRIYSFPTIDATTFQDEDFMGNSIYRGGTTFNQSDADAMWEFDQVNANKMTLYLTPSGANSGLATYSRK